VSEPQVDFLLAEDNPSDAELILQCLHEYSNRLLAVHDGEEALDYLFCRGPFANRSPLVMPRVVVLDVKLPKIDGLAVLRAMRGDPRTRPIPVVMLTSSKLQNDVATAYRLGANSYVQKPVEFDRFRETVRALGAYWLTINEPLPPATFQEPR